MKPEHPGRALLALTATCGGKHQCVFEGKDLPIILTLTNHQSFAVGFPKEFVQKQGPVIKLVDARNETERFLRKGLADLELKRRLTPISPGNSVEIEWIIFAHELDNYASPHLDINAEFTVQTEIWRDEIVVEFEATDTIRIVGKNAPQSGGDEPH